MNSVAYDFYIFVVIIAFLHGKEALTIFACFAFVLYKCTRHLATPKWAHNVWINLNCFYFGFQEFAFFFFSLLSFPMRDFFFLCDFYGTLATNFFSLVGICFFFLLFFFCVFPASSNSSLPCTLHTLTTWDPESVSRSINEACKLFRWFYNDDLSVSCVGISWFRYLPIFTTKFNWNQRVQINWKQNWPECENEEIGVRATEYGVVKNNVLGIFKNNLRVY